MPISRTDFARGETDDSYDQRIVRFLAARPTEAFTSAEIWEGLYGSEEPKSLGLAILRGLAIGGLTNQLDRLAREGRIQRRTVKTRTFDVNYYTANLR